MRRLEELRDVEMVSVGRQSGSTSVVILKNGQEERLVPNVYYTTVMKMVQPPQSCLIV